MANYYKITLTVGTGLDKAGKAVDPTKAANLRNVLAHSASHFCGGATFTNSEGAWIAPNGDLVREAGFIMSCLCSGHHSRAIDNQAAKWADIIKYMINQECVVYTRQAVEVVQFL